MIAPLGLLRNFPKVKRNPATARSVSAAAAVSQPNVAERSINFVSKQAEEVDDDNNAGEKRGWKTNNFMVKRELFFTQTEALEKYICNALKNRAAVGEKNALQTVSGRWTAVHTHTPPKKK